MSSKASPTKPSSAGAGRDSTFSGPKGSGFQESQVNKVAGNFADLDVGLDDGDRGWEVFGKKNKNRAVNAGRGTGPASRGTGPAPTRLVGRQEPQQQMNLKGKPTGSNWRGGDSRGRGYAQSRPGQVFGRGREPAVSAPTPVIPPPLQNGWQWGARAAVSRQPAAWPSKDPAKVAGNPRWADDDIEDSESDTKNGTKDDEDDDEDLTDVENDDEILFEGSDSDESHKSHETRKKNKRFVQFFFNWDNLSVEEISEPSRQWHCPVCQGGRGGIDWYTGLQALVVHTKTTSSKRLNLHRELAGLLEEEIHLRGVTVGPMGEAFGKWKGLNNTVDREIVWPPMVMIRNTILDKDDKDKWIGMGNQELLLYFDSFAAVKARHSYGPQGHRGISVLIFESTVVGYMDAERLHQYFVDQGTDRDAWERRRVLYYPGGGGKRQLYGYMATKEDLDIFNQHSYGLSCLSLSCDGSMPDYHGSSQFKRRKVICDYEDFQLSSASSRTSLLPVFTSPDYYVSHSICELMASEVSEKNYCSRVKDFAVGRLGYGRVKFFGETDVQGLNVEEIVSFNRHEVIVYGDESSKPAVGQGLNKAAEVTLVLQITLPVSDGRKLDALVRLLKISTERQGAHFISFDAASGEWIFSVQHFSRFGLTDDEEEDIIMDDVVPHDPSKPSGQELKSDLETQVSPDEAVLSHSLPSHLGLDPLKMQKLRILFREEDVEELPSSEVVCLRSNIYSNEKNYYKQAYSHTPEEKPASSPARKSPLALVEYMNSTDMIPQKNIFMIRRNKGLPIRTTKVEGFQLNPNLDTPFTNFQSRNVVDAALFMGKSFRVGWGPNGILLHSGSPVNSPGFTIGLSSTIHVEKVAFDECVRDENSKVKDELVDLCFSSSLELHKSFSYPTDDTMSGPLKLRRLILDRQKLSKVCDGYIELIQRQYDPSSPTNLLSSHQATIWELIKVLFADNERNHQSDVDEDDMMEEKIDSQEEIDIEAYPLLRRARFSEWLRLSVRHRVQKEMSYLNETNSLQHIFSLLTGRQLDSAVELAALRGEVRMACLLSQAGGSMVSRSDMARQLEIWKSNGLDFDFIENDRIRLYELLAGNIHGALQNFEIDWKRYIGLLMWYQLAPDTSLPDIVRTYQQHFSEGRAPYPVPIYADEKLLDGAPGCGPGDRFDIAFYLLLLHADLDKDYKFLNAMFSAYSSTSDSLDYHMIWHQRALLDAIGVFSSKNLHIVDMSFISQLLCVGLCHWAIYAVLHIPYRDDLPYLHSKVIREILFQYCETWSTDEVQQRVIEDLGVPSEWLHEALAVFYEYHKDEAKALEHYLRCFKWQKAHMIFMTSVAHILYFSSQHSQVLRLATAMEEHKSEIADWDLGAGIYISFYLLKTSLQVDIKSNELESLEEKSDACKLFVGRLNESLSVWGNRLPIDTRYTYSKMAEELFGLLVASSWEDSTRDVQLACFDTMLMAPIPEDKRSCHLQDALSVFTYFVSESTVP